MMTNEGQKVYGARRVRFHFWLNRVTSPALVLFTGRTLYDRAIERAQAKSLRD